MKRILALVLVAVMLFALVSCGGNTTTTDATNQTSGMENVKFGIICLHDEQSTYDLNFINAAKDAQKALGLSDDQVIFKYPVDETKACYDAAVELAEEGCNIIFADSFGHEQWIINAAKEYPEIQFCHATGTKAHTEGLKNYHNAFAAIYEGRYLAGIAAGMKLNEMIASGKITAEQAVMGYVGAFPYAEVKSGYTSFYLGAKSVCPTVTMLVDFTQSWYDVDAEKDIANALMDKGAVLISQHADSMGAPSACEERNVPDISYNGSTVASCPNTFIVSSRINWQPYFEMILKNVAEGRDIATDYIGTLVTGSVELTEVNEKAAAEGTQAAIDAAIELFKTDSLKVFDTSTFTVNGSAVTSYLADVDDMGDYVPETEVIKTENGVTYFAESEFRAAPYFDIDIDGITILSK